MNIGQILRYDRRQSGVFIRPDDDTFVGGFLTGYWFEDHTGTHWMRRLEDGTIDSVRGPRPDEIQELK